MARKRDQTGAIHFRWQHVAPRCLMHILIVGRHWLNQHWGDQALGSQIKLLHIIDERKWRACWRDGEGPAIAGFPTERLVPVIGVSEAVKLRENAGLPSGFRNRHRSRLSAGRQRPVDGLRPAHLAPPGLTGRQSSTVEHGFCIVLPGNCPWIPLRSLLTGKECPVTHGITLRRFHGDVRLPDTGYLLEVPG